MVRTHGGPENRDKEPFGAERAREVLQKTR
jgi:hypothetical protein